MTHQKSGATLARLLVIAPLAVLFAVLSWSNASAGIQVAAPVTAATLAADATVAVSMPMSGTMLMQGMDHNAMHGSMPLTGPVPMRGMNRGETPMRQMSQPDMCQMMTTMVDMHRRMAQMYDMMAGTMAVQGCMPMTGVTQMDGSAEEDVGQTSAMTVTMPGATTSPQATVHDMGGHVMPFDLSRTTHIFEMTESGGIQEVIAEDPSDSEQIALIQQHLQHEAALFSAGDFSDPLTLHGTDMPGVKELNASVAQVKVAYSALPNGAQIVFTTEGIHLITALHRWFGAQLSDHGADATYR